MPTPEKEDVGDYSIVAKIGQGSFATVYEAKHKITGQIVAIKSVMRSKLTKKLIENLESEITILKAIRHDHIVGLIECHKTSTHVHLVMEYCSMGDLSQYIKRMRADKTTRTLSGGLPEAQVRHFLKQLVSALKFLRSQNLIHRDIKPQNLLLVSPQEEGGMPNLKVADFGFARFLPNASLADTLCGSPLYMGPEILSYKKYDAKADLWSVGAVLYEMITGRPPFRAQNHLELLKKIQEADDNIRFPDEKHPTNRISSDLKDLIRKLLKRDPADRISFEQLFSHVAVVREAYPAPVPSSSSSHSMSPSSATHGHNISPANMAYEPPPFAQPSPRPTPSTTRSNTMRGENTSPDSAQRARHSPSRNVGDETRHSPRESSMDARRSPRMHTIGALAKRNSRGDLEEEMLQGYVVLDRRIIETNQFADGTITQMTPVLSIVEIKQSDAPQALGIRSLAPRRGSYDRPGHSPSPPASTPPFMARERKISAGPAGSALAKALSKASVRLFGTGHSPPNFGKPPSLRQGIGSPQKFMIAGFSTDQGEDEALRKIERWAYMAHTVAKFADEKFNMLMADQGYDTVLAEEAMVLHFKALALLEAGMSMARQFWIQVPDEQARVVSVRLNDSVQWMRDRFNECLDRASFERAKCAAVEGGGKACVEKLLYNKALEMSRAAAVHELLGERIAECEQDYQNAIWLLEAIMEARDENDLSIENDDQRIINKFVDAIQHRLFVLRKKFDAPEASTQPSWEVRLTDRLPPHE